MRLSTRTGTVLAASLLLAASAGGAAADEPEAAPAPSPSVKSPAPPRAPSPPPSSTTAASATDDPDPEGADGPESTPTPATSTRPATPAKPTAPVTPTTSATPTATAKPTATASPTDSPTKPAADSELYVVLTVPDPVVRPGEEVKAVAHVYATGAKAEAGRLKVTATRGVKAAPDCALSSGACDLGDVTAEGELIPVELSVSEKAEPGTLRITTAVSSRTAPAKTVVHLLTIGKKDAATPSASAPAPTGAPTASPPSAQPGTTTTPYSALPSTPLPQPSASDTPSLPGDQQLPPIVADTSPTAQPLSTSRNVAAIHPGSPDAADTLVRLHAVWLGVLLAFFAAFALRLRRSAPGAHRRTRGRFAR